MPSQPINPDDINSELFTHYIHRVPSFHAPLATHLQFIADLLNKASEENIVGPPCKPVDCIPKELSSYYTHNQPPDHADIGEHDKFVVDLLNKAAELTSKVAKI